MKRNFKITLQYEGTRYRGWQKQGNTDNTVQARVERALEDLCGAPVEARGSGRTDAGVHALGQVVSAAMDTDLTPQEVRDGLNAHLPADIAAVDCEERDLRFHARLNARRKTYRYRIHQGPVPDVFGCRWAWDCPETLDLAAMEQAAAKLMGERDFQSFCDLKNSKNPPSAAWSASTCGGRGTTSFWISRGTASSTTWPAFWRGRWPRWGPIVSSPGRWRTFWPPMTGKTPAPWPRPRGSPFFPSNIKRKARLPAQTGFCNGESSKTGEIEKSPAKAQLLRGFRSFYSTLDRKS